MHDIIRKPNDRKGVFQGPVKRKRCFSGFWCRFFCFDEKNVLYGAAAGGSAMSPPRGGRHLSASLSVTFVFFFSPRSLKRNAYLVANQLVMVRAQKMPPARIRRQRFYWMRSFVATLLRMTGELQNVRGAR